jgi:folate-binding protein YgfZ
MNTRTEALLGKFGPIFNGSTLTGFSTPSNSTRGALLGPECAQLQCTGEDASEFISRMTTLSPQKMLDRDHQQGFLLEHNGKIKVSFELYIHDQKSLSLICAPSEIDVLADTLEMFHFAEDIEFTKHSPRQMLMLMTSDVEEQIDITHDIVLEQWRGQADLHALVCTQDQLAAHVVHVFDSGHCVGNFDEFEQLRIGLGIGSWLTEYTAKVTPLDVNGLSGIVQQKGCYPGQEVIERTIALGRPSKKLAMIVGEQLCQGDEILNESDQNVGVITSTVNFDETSMCGLAIVKGRVDFSQAFHTPQGTVSLQSIEA